MTRTKSFLYNAVFEFGKAALLYYWLLDNLEGAGNLFAAIAWFELFVISACCGVTLVIGNKMNFEKRPGSPLPFKIFRLSRFATIVTLFWFGHTSLAVVCCSTIVAIYVFVHSADIIAQEQYKGTSS